MIEKIKIHGTKLELERYVKETKISKIPNPKSLKYQTPFCLDAKKDSVVIISELSYLISDESLGKEFILVRKHNRETNFEVSNYSKEEVQLMLSLVESIMYSFYVDRLDLAENLVYAISDPKVTYSFYKSYGNIVFNTFNAVLTNSGFDIETYETKHRTLEHKSSMIYQGKKRYSIYQLLNDLVEDNAKFYSKSSEMFEEYEKISSNSSTRSNTDRVEFENVDWYNIKGIVRSMTRANMSLSLEIPVKVKVPDNKFDVPNEIFAVSIISRNIIKDGLLNSSMERIGVKVSKKLETRLRRVPNLVDDAFIRDGELLLNLQYLPVITKPEIGKMGSLHFTNLIRNRELLTWAYSELKALHKDVSDKKKFLSKLSINQLENGDYLYTPVQDTYEKSHSYSSICVSSKVIKKSFTNRKLIDELKSRGPIYLKNRINETKIQISDIVFRLILSKHGKFRKDKEFKSIENILTTYKDYSLTVKSNYEVKNIIIYEKTK